MDTPKQDPIEYAPRNPDLPDEAAHFGEDTTLDEVRAALEAAALRVRQLDAAGRAIERERSIEALQLVRISAPARLVDTFFDTRPVSRPIALFTTHEPSPEPQQTAILLGDLTDAIRRFLYIPDEGALALALFAMHTWTLSAAQFTPRLAITSPTKGCGKTTVLDVLRLVCRNPIMVANVTAAAVFRLIAQYQPTLLLDEADTFLGDNQELRGVLNAGYASNGTVIRCAPETLEPQVFACFAPAAIAAIGKLPGTLADRAIPLRMERKPKGTKVEHLDSWGRDELEEFGPRLARWSQDTTESLMLPLYAPDLPDELGNRQRDIIEPLLTIAERAGGEWPQRARTMVLRMFRGAAEDAADTGERLLAAVWAIFEARQAEFLALKVIRQALLEDETGGWSEANRGREISTSWLSKMMRRFGVELRQRSPDGNKVRGFLREELEPVVARYLGTSLREVQSA